MIILSLSILVGIKVSEGTWDPYCPWNLPGIDKQLYSCSNNISNIQLNPFSLVNQRKKIKVGLLFPQDMADCTYIDLFNQGIAAEIAVEDINSNPDLIPEFELELVNASEYRDCGRSFDTLGYAYTLRVQEGVDVLIGPACGDGNSGSSVASFAAAENLPVISVASFQDDLNDVEKYPTFTRLYESTEIQAYYHAGVYEYFGWEEIVTIVQNEVKPECTAKWANLTRTLKDMGYTKIKKYSLFSNNTLSNKNMTTILKGNRIVSLFGSPDVVRQVVLSFYRVCKDNSWCKWSDYRFIIVNFQIGFVISNEQILPWSCDQSLRVYRERCFCCPEVRKKDDEEAKQAFMSVIYIVSDVPKFSEQDDLFCKLMKKLKESPHKVKHKASCIEQVFLIQHVYDTVLVYAHALNRTKDPKDGRKISNEFKHLTNITGKSGKIRTNPQGSRYTEMLAYFLLDESDKEMTAVLKLLPTIDTGRYTAEVINGQRDPGRFRIPDKPPCEWHDFTCEGPLSTLIAGVFVTLTSIVGGTILRIWLTQRKSPHQSFFITSEQLEKLMEAKTADIDKNFKPVFVQRTDIIVSTTDKTTADTLRGLNQVHHSNIVQLLHCCMDTTGLTLVLEDCPKGPLQHLIRTEQRVKTASFIKSFATDILRGLAFLQGSTFSYHGALTSLNCVVDANWNVKLKGFYMRQVKGGEIYSNHDLEMKAMNTPRQVYDGLWMSPQYHNGEIEDRDGFQKNDIYSFGVILAELINGEPPFGIFFDEKIDVKVLHDQIELIKAGEKPLKGDETQTQNFEYIIPSETSSISSDNSISSSSLSSDADKKSIRSKKASEHSSKGSVSSKSASESPTESTLSYQSSDFNEYGDFEDDLTIVKQFCLLCTQNEPEERMTIEEILDRLETGSQSNLGSLVDQWLVTLEKKSRELKGLFDLKNKDLFKEKERTKDLVYSLLPREIAEQKMMSEAPIAPQVFSNCSFFYSDIKGFTSIVADLTNLEDGGPMDVVEMLDNLYTIMDKAIGKHNVVKIETIGDAYVVVSGLPVPDVNGSAHARHIAAFALDVLSTTKDITVKRLNNRPVYMRIGIHSGSCVAGLAGNYMYHYCIYGKEPRYANNLESSGEANRIHMSNDMRHILEKNFQHQFSFVERKPSVHISGFKSKSARTWWLTGEAGVQRDMPKDDIYKNLEFKRKTSSTANPKLLIKGVAKLRGEMTSSHIRTLSESSEKSAKSRKNRSGSVPEVLKTMAGMKTNHIKRRGGF